MIGRFDKSNFLLLPAKVILGCDRFSWQFC